MPFLIFLLLVGFVIFIRLFMDSFDRDRIRNEVGNMGGRVIDIAWNPFARGWFGEKGERHYNVSYRTRNGRTINTACKTSMWTGVYWTSDQMPGMNDPEPAERSGLYCRNCGYALQDDWVACPKCGKNCR